MFTHGQKVLVVADLFLRMGVERAVFDRLAANDEFCYVTMEFEGKPHSAIRHSRVVIADTPENEQACKDIHDAIQQRVADFKAGKRGSLDAHVEEMLDWYSKVFPQSADPQGRARTSTNKQMK